MCVVTIEMQQAELMLRHRVALLRGAPVAAGGIGEICDNPVSAGVEQSQPIRGLGIFAGSGPRPFLQGCGVIATFIRLTAALHRCLWMGTREES